MSAVAPAPGVTSVIEQMDALLRPLRRQDGVACFTRLYLEVTRGVQARLAGTTFADPSFLARLDQNFAALFFHAMTDPPPAWRPLVEDRERRGIAPIQFALAGMNAHINRDLPLALVTTARAAGIELREGSPQHADYLRVNGVLAAVEHEVVRDFVDSWALRLARLLGMRRAADAVAMWDVARARDAAWVNGEALWALQGAPELAARFVDALDHSVGLAGRGLLLPARRLF